jgi:two-component SAPR family response regulator
VTLLKFLVAHLGRAVPREVLSECLWPDADERSGRERLKVTVYALRRQLRAAGMTEDIVETAGEAYVLRREAVWVDAEAFERCIAEGAVRQRQRRWDEALQCYGEAQRLFRGDYMEEDVYADWCAEERERLREVYLEMLASTAECHAELGHYAEAVQVCRTALVRDSCRESFHRALMENLIRLGRADWAIVQYHRCRRVLADKLGVEPMRETQGLYRKILARNTPRQKKTAERSSQ